MTTDQNSTTAAAPANPAAEPSMAEYAAQREAEIRGEKPAKVPPAVAAGPTEDAVATETEDQSAAATTEEEGTEGETTSEAATEEGTATEDAPAAGKGNKGINKRFSEMTAEKKELQAKLDQSTAEATAAKQLAEQATAEANRLRILAEQAQAAIPQVAAEKDDPAPVQADFDDPDAYVVALSAHAARKAIREATAAANEAAQARAEQARKDAEEARQKQVQAQVTELHTKFQERVAAVKPEYPDYDEKVTNNDKIQLRNDVFFTIETVPDAAHILYHLATNPSELEAINKLDPTSVAVRIGELQAELRIARKPKVSKAATPHKPLGSRASPQQKSPNEESMEEYAARVNAETQAKAGSRRPRLI